MNTYLSEEQMKGDQIVIDAMGKNNFQQIQEQAHDILLKERMGKQSGLVSVHGKIVKQPRKYVIINLLQIISPYFTLPFLFVHCPECHSGISFISPNKTHPANR